jgi:hypothetical protein
MTEKWRVVQYMIEDECCEGTVTVGRHCREMKLTGRDIAEKESKK